MDTIQPIEYTNRLGKTYYLFQGKTKLGNPRYFFSPDATGGKTECVPLDHIPEGFELFEHPNSNVVLRKKIKTNVLPQELFHVRELVEELEREDEGFTWEIYKKQLGFVLSSAKEYFQQNHVWRYRAEVEKDSIIVYEVRYHQAEKVLRFELVNKKTRTYKASRWVFTGMGRWRSLHKTGTIEEIAKEYCSKLGTDDYFEML